MKGPARSALALLCALIATAGCRREDKKQSHSVAQPKLPPLVVPAPSDSMKVSGFGDAVIAAPSGATEPAPVLVAVLGIGDTPESQCAVWGELVGQRAFVLCPRGVPHFVRESPEPTSVGIAEPLEGEGSPEAPPVDGGKLVQSGFYVPDLSALETEVAAGLAALRVRHGRYVASGPVVYAGFSRGAFLGASLIGKNPALFTRAILVEGGQSAWTDESAATFARGGGKRVLFACGRTSCVAEAQVASAVLARQRVETRIVHGAGEGHGYKLQVKDQIRPALDWVIEGDPSWRSAAPGPNDKRPL